MVDSRLRPEPAKLGGFLLHCDQNPRLLFTENDTNNEQLFGRPNPTCVLAACPMDLVLAFKEVLSDDFVVVQYLSVVMPWERHSGERGMISSVGSMDR